MNRRDRKSGFGIGQWMVVLLSTFGLLLTGCNSHRNEERHPHSGANNTGTISFAPSVSDTWANVNEANGPQSGTARATSENGIDSGIGSVVDAQSLELGEVAGEPLYLHITTTEGIAGSSVGTASETDGLRAAPVTDMQTYGGFGVTAYHYNAGSSASGRPNLMNKVHYNTYNTGSGGHWTAASTYRWMPGRVHDFYAWAPYSTTGYSVSDPTGGAAPTISVTIPANVADQKDLLVAKATGVAGLASSSTQQLTFNHALTAVKFKAADVNTGIEITSITLEGVLNQGTYDLGTEQWTPHSGRPRVSFTQRFSTSVTSTGVAGQEITGGATTFMMLPQQFNSGTPLTVKVGYQDGATSGEITGTINTPHKWEAGKMVTYEISSTSINWTYTFEITQTPSAVPHTGGTSNFKITSTKKKNTSGATPVAVNFEVKEVYDEVARQWTTTIPNWFNGGNTITRPGGTDVSSGSISIAPQTTSRQGVPGLATLQNATPKGTSTAPYTLEDEGGTVPAETANCYVIQAPGHYSLPLVYGNAIKNGTTNSSAYTTTASGSYILNPFINHLGQSITGPDLPPPVSAGIVWQDEKDLVTNVRLDTSNKRLLFEVNRNNIREGNAVVAVYDSNSKAIWSWHIWVTAQDVFTPISVKTHSTYVSQEIKFMPCNLGEARSRETSTYPRRALRAKVVQSGSNREIEVTFVQNEGAAEVGGHRSPYYQWGRKDPFIPSNGINKTNQAWYDSRGNRQTSNPTYTSWGDGNTSVQNSIADPGTFNTNSSTNYYNLWNSNNNLTTVNNNGVVKTIYDPSPRGYAMPPTHAFTGFTTTGGNTSSKNQFNVVGNFDKGWYFKTGYSAPNDKIYFPDSGRRDHNDASLNYVDSYGYYWTAGPGITNFGCFLGFSSGGVNPQGGSRSGRRSYGFSVRPCQ